MKDIYQRIKQDHDHCRDLFARLKDTTDRAEKSRLSLFEELKIELWAHHKIEEAVFYSKLETIKATRGEAFEAVNEHHVANGLLEELDSMPVDNPQWLTKLGVLQELVTHHMEEEEGEIFEEAREVLDDAIAKRMGEAMDERKTAMLSAMSPLDI
ncbi:MAG: hemerythrin domain-containing protein [Inquilinaceae bacterium]